MTITYQVGNSLYLNITNRCNCSCIFCIRRDHTGVGDGENLWLEHEPTVAEIITDLKSRTLSAYDEIVFCGYGEPTERLDVLLEVCKYLKQTTPDLPIRLNTNGLANLLHNQNVPPLLDGVIDVISISLNAPNQPRYNEITRPQSGENAFEAMLQFARAVTKFIPKVQFSVVDILTPEEIQQCHQLADAEGIPLRVRTKS